MISCPVTPPSGTSTTCCPATGSMIPRLLLPLLATNNQSFEGALAVMAVKDNTPKTAIPKGRCDHCISNSHSFHVNDFSSLFRQSSYHIALSVKAATLDVPNVRPFLKMLSALGRKSNFVILSVVSVSRSEADAESKDPSDAHILKGLNGNSHNGRKPATNASPSQLNFPAYGGSFDYVAIRFAHGYFQDDRQKIRSVFPVTMFNSCSPQTKRLALLTDQFESTLPTRAFILLLSSVLESRIWPEFCEKSIDVRFNSNIISTMKRHLLLSALSLLAASLAANAAGIQAGEAARRESADNRRCL